MPKQPKVTINGSKINGILDVHYNVGRGWDPFTGLSKGDRRFGTVTIVKEMEEQSFSFFKKACLPNETFKAEIAFVRNDPKIKQDEEYIWITLESALVTSYTINHQDWKNKGLSDYNAVEVIEMGYETVTVKTKDGSHSEKFKPAAG
jgi:type VI secretion system Hcp family effector